MYYPSSKFNNKLVSQTYVPSSQDIQHQKSLNYHIQLLGNCIKTLNANLESSSNKENIQERFEPIKINIPQIYNSYSQSKQAKLEQWLGELARTVFSKGFKLYETGVLNEKKLRSYCCQNMVYNIMEMTKQNKLHKKEIELINECLQYNIIPYLKACYSKSQDSEVNLKFAHLIRKIDNFENNQNDLVFRSGIKFQYSEQGQYYSTIMQFLSYVIDLPNSDERIQAQSKSETRPLGDCFEEEVSSLFLKIYREKDVIRMMEFQRLDPIELKESQIKRNEMKMVTEAFFNKNKNTHQKDHEKEYSQKVADYTKYQIGRKIPSNTLPFTEEQIQNEKLLIQNKRVMRIMIKWCEELEKHFQPNNLFIKEDQFKMQDGSQSFISHESLVEIAKILSEERKTIKKYKKELLSNNQELQQHLSMEEFDKEFRYLPELDRKVGLWSSIMLKSVKNYLINYLNALIHGLLRVSKKYVFLLKNVDKVTEEKKFMPQLITFKCDDLLRCRCTSKETEIIALYTQIERINYYHPQIFKIVKIKNELTTESKTLIINLLYRNRIMAQIQLVLESQKSKFLKHANKFHEFLCELERAHFGIMSQFCHIWSTDDSRAAFYEKKQLQLQEKAIIRKKDRHECKNEEEEVNLPFKCQFCHYYHQKFYMSHKFCKACKKHICIYCQFKSIGTYEEIRRKFPSLPEPREGEVNEIVKVKKFQVEDIPKEGLLLDLEDKRKQFKPFIKLERQKVIMMREMKGGKEIYKILCTIIEENCARAFFKNYIIIKMGRRLQEIDMRTLTRDYLVEIGLKEAIVKKTESIVQNKKFINDATLNKIQKKMKTLPEVKKITLNENQIKDFNLLTQMLPDAKRMVLWKNMISKISSFSHNIDSLQYLYLSDNKIKDISTSVGSLKKLKVLDLSRNIDLEYIPSSICKCEKLEELYLNETRVEDFPADMDELINLRILQAKKTKISFFSKELGMCRKIEKINLQASSLKVFEFRELNWEKLVELNLSQTQIKQITQQIKNCTKLKKLNLSLCQNIKRLPNGLGKCTNLTDVDLSYLSLMEGLPEDFSQLSNLKRLILSYTNIKYLPLMNSFPELTELHLDGVKIRNLISDIGDCQNLKTLSLYKSDIHHIPESLSECWKLENLNLGKSQIKSFPDFMKNFTNLKHLSLAKCNINIEKQVSEKLLFYPKLKSLELSGLNLQRLPENITKLTSLKEIILSHNRFEEFPSELLFMKGLSSISLENNYLKEVPRTLGRNLTFLNLKKNRIGKVDKVLKSTLEGLSKFEELKIDSSVLGLGNAKFKVSHI